MDADPDPRMSTLGDDLVLLSVSRGSGRIAAPAATAVGLMGSELVRLAAAGRIGIDSGRINVADAAPTGDAEADAALASLAAQRRPPRASAWCSRPRRGIVDAYLARLAAAGVIRSETQQRLGFIRVTRWQVTDPARVTGARARLDAIARGTGQVDLAQAAYGGLAHAIGLGGSLYPGRDGRAQRKRLETVAAGDLTADTPGPAQAAHHAVHAASHAAVHAAVHAATHAAVCAAPAPPHSGPPGAPGRGPRGRARGHPRGRVRGPLRTQRWGRRPRRRRRPPLKPRAALAGGPRRVSGRGAGYGPRRPRAGPGCPRHPAR